MHTKCNKVRINLLRVNNLIYIFVTFLLDYCLNNVDLKTVKTYILQVNSLLVPGVKFRAFLFWAL